MQHIKRFILVLFFGAALQIAAQENTQISTEEDIEDFQLPTFSELSNNIATDYNTVLEALPDLSNIGAHGFDANQLQQNGGYKQAAGSK